MRGKRGRKIKISVALLVLILFMGGSALGAYIETGIDGASRTGALHYIDSILQGSGNEGVGAVVFKESLKNNGTIMLIMGAGGISVLLFPVALAVILYKGMALGFTSAVILEGGADKGIAECCVALLPQNLILIPLLGVYCYFTVCMAMSVIRCRNKRYRGRIYTDNMKVYLMITAVSFIVLCAAAAVEGFINPLLSALI